MHSALMLRLLTAVVGSCALSSGEAAQVNINGPAGSVSYGAWVTVLPNGNFVVTDPDGPVSGIGAVYLYSPGGSLISSLYGSTANDHVGKNGVFVIGSNLAVVSGNWHNGAATNAGAVTWMDGTTGFVTGSAATSNVVSSANSLVGTHTNDFVGVVTLLTNGNYVVQAYHWNGNVGAVTWCKGDGSVVGAVSSGNSLTGSIANDSVGKLGVTALSDGNYVVASPYWTNSAQPAASGTTVGAATWLSGSGPFAGVVSASNSLIGTTESDNVGVSGIVALSNGHYVVSTYSWQDSSQNVLGAVTWRSGGSASPGTVSASNSLTGAANLDYVGIDGTIALSNGNYVVKSGFWNGTGAVTWGSGSTGTVASVSAADSLVGTGSPLSVTALSNGKYVVATPNWDNGTGQVGAAILIDGSAAHSGTISSGNALVGTSVGDSVGGSGVTALSDGNYLVLSSAWNNNAGAATWGNGSTGTNGPVLPSNSLIGSASSDKLGDGNPVALPNGNYVVFDSQWTNGVAGNIYGAATWCRAGGGCVGPVSTARSFHGTTSGDGVGAGGHAFNDGNYVIVSPQWTNNGAGSAMGAITLANGRFRLKGTIAPWNSVIGGAAGGGPSMFYAYDVTLQRLIVGRRNENLVSLFTMEEIFADDLDS